MQNDLDGEYKYQNIDGKYPGKVGPFWERFGHSLDTVLSRRLQSDGSYTRYTHPVMILAGGYAPEPMNDIWASEDGTNWHMVHNCDSVLVAHVLCRKAGWSERGWHASAVYRGKLWVLGGAPLNNEVWAGQNLTRYITSGKPVWNMNWVQYGNRETVAWSPRAGLSAVAQTQQWFIGRDTEDEAGTAENYTIYPEFLYVMGGFAGWEKEDSRYDGKFARNDVYRTEDGTNWTRLDASDGQDEGAWNNRWPARAFHSAVTWSDSDYRFRDVTEAADRDADEIYATNKGIDEHLLGQGQGYTYRREKLDDIMNSRQDKYKKSSTRRDEDTLALSNKFGRQTSKVAPRMWLSGGAYFGLSAPRGDFKSEVQSDALEGFMDLWWSRDGVSWYQVNHQEGEQDVLYSSCLSYKTDIDDTEIYLGKYGHQMISFKPRDSWISALFFIAGRTTTTTDSAYEEIGGALVNDVFMSSNGILCEIEGLTCSGAGICGAAENGKKNAVPNTPMTSNERLAAWTKAYKNDIDHNNSYPGCICVVNRYGEYCEGGRLPKSSGAGAGNESSIVIIIVVVILFIIVAAGGCFMMNSG